MRVLCGVSTVGASVGAFAQANFEPKAVFFCFFFFKVQMPLIMPGVVAGGLFAFITSFDEVVVIMFVGSSKQKTLPWQMFIGLKEQISPTILAVATILVCMSIALLVTLELLRRRSERLRGLSPS